jgi:hypothetical protein
MKDLTHGYAELLDLLRNAYNTAFHAGDHRTCGIISRQMRGIAALLAELTDDEQ